MTSLYETCEKFNIPYRKLGKLIVASSEQEREKLEELKTVAERNGVTSLALVGGEKIREREPNIRAAAGLYSPDTGIVSAHHLMDYFLWNARAGGAEIVYGTTVRGIERAARGYRITTTDSTGECFSFTSECVVNAAGLHSDEIAGMLGKQYAHRYCKGDYFSVTNVPRGMVRGLVYPLPEDNHVGLGVHVTLDLRGRMRLGPDAAYVEREENYRVDARKGDAFYESAVKFLPFLRRGDIVPDMSGIRPKLQGPGEPARDFVISEDFPGFVNLVGIESPGLTAAPAIARHVGAIMACKTAAA